MSTEAKCPFNHGASLPTTNQDWWPNQLKVELLHQHSAKSDPMGGGFDYAEEFKSLDYAALKAEQKFRAGRSTSLGRLILAPAMRFIKSYVFQRYFTCGKAGFIYSAMLAQYVFLTEARLYRLSLGKDAPPETLAGHRHEHKVGD